jgi:hypothetical protein
VQQQQQLLLLRPSIAPTKLVASSHGITSSPAVLADDNYSQHYSWYSTS